MKELAQHDRPREKLARLGVGALGDNELLAVILGHGSAECGALQLANSVLASTGGVLGLTRVDQADLRQISGVGAARAAQVLAAVELGRRTLLTPAKPRVRLASPREVATFLLPRFGAGRVEQCGIVLLDPRFGVIRTVLLSTGTADASLMHPRDVFRETTLSNAAAVVCFHNHPSGDPQPSQADILLTRRLVAAGVLMGVDVVDHLILADTRYYSFREAGELTRE